MNNYLGDGEAIKMVAAATLTAGVPFAIGGVLAVPRVDVAAAAEFSAILRGEYRLTKQTGFVPVAGDVAFYDFTDLRLEAFSFGGTVEPVGFYVEDAATGDTSAHIIWDPARARQSCLREKILIPLDATKAVTKTGYFQAPYKGKIVGLSYLTDVKPSSASGGVVGTFSNEGVSSHTLLGAATFDFEGATEDAVTAMTLTSTAADLAMAVGTLAKFAIAADNADMVAGSGIWIYVDYVRTP